MTLRPAAAQPIHVPDAPVYNLDVYHDPALLRDPHTRILEFANAASPVFWSPSNGGHVIGPETVNLDWNV